MSLLKLGKSYLSKLISYFERNANARKNISCIISEGEANEFPKIEVIMK